MEAAIALADSMDTPAILAMHAALGGGGDPDRAGRLRDQWVWIRGNSPVTADYVAPHHDTLPAAIDDLTRFARRVDIEPLTQAALAHAQFETIHPFTDGNGRTGRALVSSILRHRGVATNLTVPISSGLLVDTQAYFDALTAYREGDPHPIVNQFATAADRAIANASQLRDDVDEVADQIRATAQRRTANLEAPAGLCAAEPAFTIDMAVARGIPAPSAYRLCARLTDAGLLRRERSLPNRADVWTVPALTDALDAFARRAGRRNFQ